MQRHFILIIAVVLGASCVTTRGAQTQEDAEGTWQSRFQKGQGGDDAAPAEPGNPTPEALETGLQLNGSLGTLDGALGARFEFGAGDGRFSLGVGPSLTVLNAGSGGSSVTSTTGSFIVTARVHFHERLPAHFTGFIRPELSLGGVNTPSVGLGAAGAFGSASSTRSVTAFQAGLGALLGAEYLVNRHLGVTVELGPRMLFSENVITVHLGGSLGVVLHQ